MRGIDWPVVLKNRAEMCQKASGRCLKRAIARLVKADSLRVRAGCYSSPRRRRGAGRRLHSGHGEIVPGSAVGAVAPDGTIQS
jgi:hypothetical protein